MLTIGVDVAKSPANTSVCTVRWQADTATIEAPAVGADDDAVLAAVASPDVAAVALDAPFGWPVAMAAAVSSWRPGGRWARLADAAFRLRRTDVVTAARTKVTVAARGDAKERGLAPAVPLSVAADKVAMAAWRCCGILDRFATVGLEVVTSDLGRPFPADGRVRVLEAYPAAALAMWGIPRRGYKATDGAAAEVRRKMLTAIERSGSGRWVRWAPGARERCAATDHALDAFVCALVARAAMLGLVEAVAAEDAESARAEGWIALPRHDGLASLATGVAE